MDGSGYLSRRMGSQLERYVGELLLHDLRHYGLFHEQLVVDWSAACQEGHVTHAMGGELESASEVVVRNQAGDVIAEGWIDFVHGADELPLHAFWLDLEAVDNQGKKISIASDSIPDHVWERLPDEVRTLCGRSDGYDARWVNDPKVIQWKRRRA